MTVWGAIKGSGREHHPRRCGLGIVPSRPLIANPLISHAPPPLRPDASHGLSGRSLAPTGDPPSSDTCASGPLCICCGFFPVGFPFGGSVVPSVGPSAFGWVSRSFPPGSFCASLGVLGVPSPFPRCPRWRGGSVSSAPLPFLGSPRGLVLFGGWYPPFGYPPLRGPRMQTGIGHVGLPMGDPSWTFMCRLFTCHLTLNHSMQAYLS